MRPRRPLLEGALRVFLPLALLSATLQASAGESGSTPSSNNWNVLVGAGAINAPRYPGSRFDYTRGLPALSLTYGRFFVGGAPGGGGGPAGLGAYLVRTEHWEVGVTVGGDTRKPRRASDDPVLHGWGDISGTVRGGLFASYSIEWLSI